MLGFALPVGAFARFMAVAAGWISSGKRTLPLVLDVDQTLVDAMPHRVTGEPAGLRHRPRGIQQGSNATGAMYPRAVHAWHAVNTRAHGSSIRCY